MTINEKLSKIQVEFKSKKSRFNSFGKYYFRSAEDILEATKPFLKELKVTVTVDEELVSFDPPVMQVTATVSDGKDTISSSVIVTCTPNLNKKGFVASRISSADRKLYLPNELNLDFFDLNSVWIVANFSFIFIRLFFKLPIIIITH